MAPTALPSANVTYTFIDETGSTATATFDLPGATTLADAQAAATALRTRLNDISDCQIVSDSITYTTVDRVAPAPAVGSRVERKGVFVFGTAAGKTSTYQVPGIKDAAVLKDGRIDEDETDVAAFILGMVTNPWSDSNGSDIITNLRQYERYRSTTRKMLPSKKNPDLDTTPGN